MIALPGCDQILLSMAEKNSSSVPTSKGSGSVCPSRSGTSKRGTVQHVSPRPLRRSSAGRRNQGCGMSFSPVWTEEAAGIYQDLRANAQSALLSRDKSDKKKSSLQEGLFKQVKKCIDLLLENPRHPGLNTHEFKSLPNPYNDSEKVFEAYAQQKTSGAYRVCCCYRPEKGQITILTITTHP